MAAPAILYIDTTNKRLIASFLSGVQPFQALQFEAGDLVPFQLHFLQVNPSANTAGSLPYSYIDPATLTPVSLGIGAIGATPTDGTFTVTYGADTTSALAFNISASALQTALNGLGTAPSGGWTVTGAAGGPFRIVFNTPGVISTLFEVNATDLAPTSLGITAVAVTGATGISEVQVIRLIQSPAAFQDSWTATYGAISVTRLQAGGSGINEIQQVAVPIGTFGGSFALTFGGKSTAALLYNSTAAQVQAALQALTSIGTNNCQVQLTSPVTWSVTFTGSLAGLSQSLITATGTGLQMPEYLAGTVNLNVEGVFDLIGLNDSAAATLQIQQGTSGNINTVLQTGVTLNNTLIQGTPSIPNPADPWQTLSQVLALIDTPANLPLATTTTVGGVIVPTAGNLAVDGSGNISVPLATASVFGVIKPNGTSITISSGIISTAQDIRATASPTFVGATFSGAVSGITTLGATNFTISGTQSSIGRASVASRALVIAGVDSSTSNYALNLQNGSLGNIALFRNDGQITFSTSGAVFDSTGLNSCPIGATTPSTAVFTGITMGSGTGTVTAASGVFSVTSDKSAKNDRGAFTIGLDAILALNPVLYDFKADKKHLVRAGFYTQDVEKVIPQAVFHDSPDGLGSLDDRPIIAALVNAVKELTRRLTLLESR